MTTTKTKPSFFQRHGANVYLFAFSFCLTRVMIEIVIAFQTGQVVTGWAMPVLIALAAVFGLMWVAARQVRDGQAWHDRDCD